MASKTPNNELETPGGHNSTGDSAVSRSAGQGSAKGLPGEDDGGGSDDDEDDGYLKDQGAGTSTTTKKKKKPRKKKKRPTQQSNPPDILLSKLFPDRSYPSGEEVAYKDGNLNRTTSEERRSWEKANSDYLSDYRQAAEAHRQVRQWAQRSVKPGQTLTAIAQGIEDSVRRILGHDGLSEGDAVLAGMGFPTGLNLNNTAAHYSPNIGCKLILQERDVIKIDIGVHVNGRIVDSAFTMSFDPMYDNLLMAVKEATNTGLREAGIDVRLGELGGYIQETMESFECEINGTTYPIKPIRNLSGHTILPYSIHGTKTVPLIATDDITKMEEGDVFAIETFGTTGDGYTVEQGECSHYALRRDAPKIDLPSTSARALLSTIKKNFNTIPFCRRYLDRIGQEKYLYGLNQLVRADIVEDYPPLHDKKGSYTAQFEHTILLKPAMKEIISRGDDY